MSLLKHIKCYTICLTFWCFCWSKKKLGGGWFSLLFNSTNKLIQFKHGRLQSFDRPQQSLFTIYNFYLQFLYNYIYCSWIFFLKVYQKLRILKARAIWNALILIFLDVFSLQNSTSDVTASTYYRGPWSPNCGPSSGAATTATTGRWSTRDAPWVSVSVCLSTGRLSVSEQESIFIVLPVMLFQHL